MKTGFLFAPNVTQMWILKLSVSCFSTWSESCLPKTALARRKRVQRANSLKKILSLKAEFVIHCITWKAYQNRKGRTVSRKKSHQTSCCCKFFSKMFPRFNTCTWSYQLWLPIIGQAKTHIRSLLKPWIQKWIFYIVPKNIQQKSAAVYKIWSRAFLFSLIFVVFFLISYQFQLFTAKLPTTKLKSEYASYISRENVPVTQIFWISLLSCCFVWQSNYLYNSPQSILLTDNKTMQCDWIQTVSIGKSSCNDIITLFYRVMFN